MSGCSHCGGCDKCGGCSGQLELNPGEVTMLQKLGQIPFLPVARSAADPAPVYLGDEELPAAEATLILQCLEKKGLVSIDFDAPLKGFSGYGAYKLRGSIALSARGQQVLELLEIQGMV